MQSGVLILCKGYRAVFYEILEAAWAVCSGYCNCEVVLLATCVATEEGGRPSGQGGMWTELKSEEEGAESGF